MNINLSTASLMRIAPFVEQIAGREVPPEDGVSPLTDDQIALRAIRREIMSDQPAGISGMRITALDQARQQRIADGNPTGMFTLNTGNGSFASINNPQERWNQILNSTQNMVDQLMQAINAARGNMASSEQVSLLNLTI